MSAITHPDAGSFRSTHILPDLDRVASPPWQQDSVTNIHAHRRDDAILVGGSRSDGDDSGLGQRVLRSRGRKVQTGSGFLSSAWFGLEAHESHRLSLESLDKNSVEEGLKRSDALEGSGLDSSAMSSHRI